MIKDCIFLAMHLLGISNTVSTFCVSRITAKIWLRDTILYRNILSKNNVSKNQAVVEYVTDKYRLLIATSLTYQNVTT